MSIYAVLMEQFGSDRTAFYELWAEINPDTAGRLSINNRSKAVLKTDKGNFPAVIIYNPAVMPGNLDVPFGLGHTVYGDNCGINPLVYSDDLYDKQSGKASFSETWVEIVQVLTGGASAQIISNEKKLTGTQTRSIYA